MSTAFQASVILSVSNGASAVACFIMAAMIIHARLRRPDVVCPLYAYPFSACLVLMAFGYITRFTAVFTKVGALVLVVDALTTVSLAISAFYVRELILDLYKVPNPLHVRHTNQALAAAVSELTEGDR